MLDGQLLADGALSVTVAVKVQVSVLPAASVTRNTLVVTPTGKADPLANPPVCVVTAPAQLSVPSGGEIGRAARSERVSTSATVLDGQRMAGGSRAVTVTGKLHVAVLPAAS